MTVPMNPIDNAELSILMVDDQPQNIAVLTTMLQYEGYQLFTANNGKVALQKVAEISPHLILLDILMPDINGYEVCKQLKADPATSGIPVIFISALADPKERIKGFEVGGLDYIVKPFDVAEVLARVRTHLTLQLNQMEIVRLYEQDKIRIAQMQREIERREIIEEALHQAIQRLTMLNRLTASTNINLSIQQVMHIISHDLHEAFNAHQVMAMLVNPNQRIATIEATSPESLRDSLPTANVILVDNPLYRRLLESAEPLTIADIHNDPLREAFADTPFSDEVQSILAAPLRTHDKTIGLFFICHHEPYEFTNEEILLSIEVSQAAAQALENSILHQRLASHNEQLGKIVAERTAQLNRLNQRMVAILASITDGIILTHPDGSVDITNSAFDTLLGYYPDELFAQPIHRIVIPEYHDLIDEALDAARNGDAQKDIQVEAIRKDGTKLDVDMSFSSVKDEENHILVNCHDITYLKQMERIKDNFISMVTHELRTPIANIMLTSNQLKKYLERMTQEQLVRKIEQLDMQSHVLAELVESVLDISRLEAQISKPRDNTVNIVEIVQGVVSELEHAAYVKQQSLELIYDEPPQAVHGDMVDFSRIWRNLISNAIKYTQNEGQITARLGIVQMEGDAPAMLSPALLDVPSLHQPGLAAGMYHVGQVADNGHGISDEDQENMFKRFHRGWAKQSSIPGTGLGLALVKELLDLYGGDIQVDSTLGQGTTFTFWIPFVADGQEPTDKIHAVKQ